MSALRTAPPSATTAPGQDASHLLTAVRPALGAYAERLVLAPRPPAGEVVPATQALDPAWLAAVIDQAGARWGTSERRVAAALWHKHYAASLLGGVLGLMTLTGVGLDADPAHAGLVMQDGLPRALLLDPARAVVYRPRLPDAWREAPLGEPVASAAALRRYVLTALLARHLAPAIARLQAVARLAPQIMWGNAGNVCAHLYEGLATHPHAAEDRAALLDAPLSAELAGPNPFHRCVRYLPLAGPDLPATVRVRRTCCLRWRLPGGEPCYVCPLLTPDARVDLLRQTAHA